MDGRTRRLALTPAGAKLHAELDKALQVLLLEVTNDIPLEQLEAATEKLNRLTRRLQSCQSVLAQ